MPTSLDRRRCRTVRCRRSGIPELRRHGAMMVSPPQRCTTAYQEIMPGDLSRLYGGRAGALHHKTFLNMLDLSYWGLMRQHTCALRVIRSSRCITGVDKVASSGGLMAGRTALERCHVGKFAVVKLGESPAVCRGVFPRVLDHELNAFLGWASYERLGMAEGFVVFFRRD